MSDFTKKLDDVSRQELLILGYDSRELIASIDESAASSSQRCDRRSASGQRTSLSDARPDGRVQPTANLVLVRRILVESRARLAAAERAVVSRRNPIP